MRDCQPRPIGCGGCITMIAVILVLWSLWFGLKTPWGVLNIDIIPPEIRLDK